jgi:glycosyltransferase involved in cell wall biosynthesis
MNILFLAECFIEPSMGGVQRVTDTLTKGFLSKGHKVFYLSIKWKQMVPDYTTTAPQFYVDVTHSVDWKNQIFSIIDKNEIEYVVNQMPGELTIMVLKELNRKVKIISVFHTQPFLDDGIKRRQILRIRVNNFKQLLFKYISFLFPCVRTKIFAMFEKRNILKCLAVSDKICFISDKFFPRVLKHIPDINVDKLSAINNPNTFNVNEITLQKENILLWVGRVENDIKNTIDFVKIWEIIYRNNPSWKAIVAGEGSDFECVKRYAQKKQIMNIDFVGRCDNIQELYRRAKFIVVTSFSESWSMVLVEGLAYCCVACAYDTYETVHDIVQGGNGFVTKPSPKDMAQKLNYYMNNPEEYKLLAEKARTSVKKFDLEAIVNQWECMLKSI